MIVRHASATVSVANTNTNGSGTIVDLVTGATHGTRIDHLIITATGSTTNGVIRFFVHDGSVWRLLKEVTVPETIAAATTPKWAAFVSLPAWYVGHNHKLGVSTHNAETFHVTAMCEDHQ